MARRNKAGKRMSLEESARRMTSLLNRAPRARKTRVYLESLPKRAKVVVQPSDYPSPQPRLIAFHPEPVNRQIIAFGKDGAEVARFVRKDRMRPKPKGEAAPELLLSAPRPPQGKGLWACRNGHRYHPGRRTGQKLIRTIDVTMRQRFLLHVAQEGLCALCGEPMDGRPFQFSLDHVIPRSLSGSDGLGNLVLCHGECNGRKTNDTPTGCELVWLLSVNARLGVEPQRW